MAEINLNLEGLSQEDLDNQLRNLTTQPAPTDTEASTGTTEPSEQVQEPSTEGIRSMQQVYEDRIEEGRDPRRP